jgi:hypothetical protein
MMRLNIGIGELLAFHSAVYEKADIEKIPLDAAAYKIAEDGLKRSKIRPLSSSAYLTHSRRIIIYIS